MRKKNLIYIYCLNKHEQNNKEELKKNSKFGVSFSS